MARVTLYTTAWCPFCVRAKQLLAGKQAEVDEIDVDRDPARRREMMERSGRRTVPQIWIGDRHVVMNFTHCSGRGSSTTCSPDNGEKPWLTISKRYSSFSACI